MVAVKPKIYLLSCIRNEGPFLLEFVAHHLAVGFSRIFIASNDSDDGSARLLAALDAAGYVTHLAHKVPLGKVPQIQGYARLRATYDIDTADWLMMLDADEFLNIHIGDHSVGALVERAPAEADIIALNAATFGSGGHMRWQPGPVTSLFQFRHVTAHRTNRDVKTISRRPEDYAAIHNHSLVQYRGGKRALTVMRGDGNLFDLDSDQPLWQQLRRVPRRDIRHDWAQYNHYAVKTPDSYRLRQDRGRGAAPRGGPNLRHDDAYFAERALAAQRDTTILRYAPALARIVSEMLTDPTIRRCQDEAEAIFAKRLDHAARH